MNQANGMIRTTASGIAANLVVGGGAALNCYPNYYPNYSPNYQSQGNTYDYSRDIFTQPATPLLSFLLQANPPMQSNTTIRVIESNGAHKDFDASDETVNEAAALDYASERADATRSTVRLLKAFAVVTPERKTTVTRLAAL